MSLLKLAADSERLRRVARAYAAGEVEEQEYRRIRSEVIERFTPEASVGDDTQQRWTPAGADAAPLLAINAEDQTDAAPQPSGETVTNGAPAFSGWRLATIVGVLAAGLIAAAALVP